jgi:hypothetical protein
LLRLGFRLGNQVYYEEKDFHDAGVELNASHHSKNIFTFTFSISPFRFTVPCFLIGENTLAAIVNLENTGATEQDVEVYAVERLELGASVWWGRDGVAGYYQSPEDQVVLRSWAAGPVFALKSEVPSSERLVTGDEVELGEWLRGAGSPRQGPTASYVPNPLSAGLKCRLRIPAHGAVQCPIYLSRSVNNRQVIEEVHTARAKATNTFQEKRAEDDRFWSRAARLEGDFPAAWKNSWVYEFETLRMMVRRPLGVYKHPWDAMVTNAPRNVLAETSADMWALSYGDVDTAKAVLLGQFQDAIEPSVPCMREDGTMNMVAMDGSECPTSLQWCYPYYCMESVFLRTLDRAWLKELYPYLTAHLEWTLKNRQDRDGWIIVKCSWESGMDASPRFLIRQPRGGELVDFIRLSELQAAMSHAARTMRVFAEVLGKSEDFGRWDRLASTYAEKTRQLWHEGWFYDQDARSGSPIVIPGRREMSQVAPVMCGVATDKQVRAMIPTMREYATGRTVRLGASSAISYLESVWRAGEREFLSRVLYELVDRIYSSMDRREVEPEKRLAWPGNTSEGWGARGASGADAYGWGALAAHIVRSIIGFREGYEPSRSWLTLGPNLPEALLANGKSFALRNVRYRGRSFDLHYEARPEGKLRVELLLAEGSGARTLRVADEAGAAVSVSGGQSKWSFEAKNHAVYRLELVD